MSLQLPKTLKGFSLFIEGRGYAGKATEVTLPKIADKMEEHLAGGLNAPVQISQGLEGLELSFTLAEFDTDVLSLYGTKEVGGVGVRIQGYLESDLTGENTKVVVTARGRWKEVDQGTWKPKEPGSMKVTMPLVYYKYASGGADQIEVDVLNGIEKFGGKDRNANRNSALGI